MTRNSRKILLATTMLAGLAIFAIDTAQAGPNGGPSLGSISGFSSTRMDFNRVGGPGRALSRDDRRIVPTDVIKTSEKPKDTKNVGKNITKKDTKVARVSNPKSSGGGKGKQDLGNGPNLHVPAAVADAYRITGGELGDLSRFDEFAKRLGLGPLTVANPLFPNNDDSNFPFPWPKTDQEPSDRNFIDGWAGYSSAPHPFGNPHGKASNGETTRYPDGSSRVLHVFPNGRDYSVTEYGPLRLGGENTGTVAREETRTTVRDGRTTREPTRTVHYDIDDPAVNGGFKDNGPRNYAEPSERTRGPRNSTGGENQDEIRPVGETSGGENPPDSQPTEEGTGRPSTQTGWCSPTGGCYRPARNASPRIIPAETDGGGTVSARRQSPSWATDPNPDGLGGGGNGGERTGYDPSQEGCDNPGACGGGDIGGPGNPALEGLNAAL